MTEIICAVVNKTTASTLFQVVMSDEQANSWIDYNLKRYPDIPDEDIRKMVREIKEWHENIF